jgi:hypothetical protein
MSAPAYRASFEVWSRGKGNEPQFHGRAFGLTFEDACKQLACDSLDFWRYYERGRYDGQGLYESAEAARS